MDQQSQSVTLKLEGRLNGPWVDELKRSWGEIKRSRPAASVVVDLWGVSFIDSQGKELLRSICRQGADLRGNPLMTKPVLEHVKNGSGNGNATK